MVAGRRPTRRPDPFCPATTRTGPDPPVHPTARRPERISMRLEGTLDAFSLPDIFQLLSYTKKTGTLHLRRGDDAHGVVHLRDGAVTGARADVRRQALGRRIVGAGVVDDKALAEAVARVQSDPACGLARALAEQGSLSEEYARALAAEQAAD